MEEIDFDELGELEFLKTNEQHNQLPVAKFRQPSLSKMDSLDAFMRQVAPFRDSASIKSRGGSASLQPAGEASKSAMDSSMPFAVARP